MRRFLFLLLAVCLAAGTAAQLWNPDLGNGKFKNPVIYADYSDPDIIRSGDQFYLVASSFNCMPGIPVLRSSDLVNWTIVNHVYERLPVEKYDKPQHGDGAWAPSIRFHDNKYYVYFCTPYDGLFVAVTDHPEDDWELRQIVDVQYWEDPCPLWDDDGNAYLVRSKLCGNELFLHKMSSDGMQILDNGVSIFRDATQPTIEGPKFMKRDGYYYILAPAGGVPSGWQTVLRAENIYGPYEAKIIMHQGNTEINGPHQGGLVNLPSGESWFIHFQDKDPYGRIVHLQPVIWMEGWPLIGVDLNNDGIGEPVLEFKKPDVGVKCPVIVPQTSDEFTEETLGLQWQWHANPGKDWYTISQDHLQLQAVKNISQQGDLWMVSNLLLQKFPSPGFTVTTRIEFHPELSGEQAGLLIMGEEWAFLAFVKEDDNICIGMHRARHNRCDPGTSLLQKIPAEDAMAYFRVTVEEGGICTFSYSFDNIEYTPIGSKFQSQPGKWIGAKVGLFCINPNIRLSKGYARFDWFRFSN